jgi:hypothetical protein
MLPQKRRRNLPGVTAAMLVCLVVGLVILRQRSRARPTLTRQMIQADRGEDVPPPKVSAKLAAGPSEHAPANDSPESSQRPPPRTPSYKARPQGEWQGMLVDLAVQPPCLDSSPCGLARACIQGVCTACSVDSDCAAGESCVLDHCVKNERVQCRSTKDCSDEGTCILSGYSSDPRGNSDMSSRCIARLGGSNKSSVKLPAVGDNTQRQVLFDDERSRARALLLKH